MCMQDVVDSQALVYSRSFYQCEGTERCRFSVCEGASANQYNSESVTTFYDRYLQQDKEVWDWQSDKTSDCRKVCKVYKKSDGDDELVFVMHEIALASRKALLEEYDILCDNQATISIFRNINMLVNITKTEDAISVGIVGGILDVDQIGELPGYGRVYYSPDCIANILCFHDLARSWLALIKKEMYLKSNYLGKIAIVFRTQGKALRVQRSSDEAQVRSLD